MTTEDPRMPQRGRRSAVVPVALALIGAGVVVYLALLELLGRGHPGFGKTQVVGILLGLALVGVAHFLANREPGGSRARDVPWMLGIVAILFVGASWWAAPSDPYVPDAGLYERLLATERAVRPPRRALDRCMPRDIDRPVGPVELEPVVTGLQKPVYVTTAGDGGRRLFIVEKGGAIRIADGDRLREEPFLDIRDRVLSDDLPGASWEQGLLGLAFPPDFASSGWFYVFYTSLPDGSVTVSRFRVEDGGGRADPASEQIVLKVPTVGPNHNGGQLEFGPEGHLYVGIGDGNGARWPHGDPAVYGDGAAEYDEEGNLVVPADDGYTASDIDIEDPWNQAQDLATLRGKILRLDVRPDSGYAIPDDNPYATDGRESTRGEIWAHGLRNPWRFSFDACDGALFAGDVGHSHYEEVDLVEPGANYGWDVMEAGHCFPIAEPQTCNTARFEFPIAEYPHLRTDASGGDAVIGGYVYRGGRIPALDGRYVFGDFRSARLWMLTPTGQAASGWEMRELLTANVLPTSFGLDADGELLIVGYGGTIHRLVPAASTTEPGRN